MWMTGRSIHHSGSGRRQYRIPPTPPGHVPDQSGSGSAGASKAQTDHVVVQCGTAEGARWDHFEWIWTKDLVGSEGEAEADGHVVNMGSGSCGCSQGRDSQAPGWSGSATNAEQVGPRRMETPSPGTACAVQARL